uniref:Anoctamin n=1 Tax=Globodera pallida TaxID=36090 RepID=A0A183BHI5_GLOPA
MANASTSLAADFDEIDPDIEPKKNWFRTTAYNPSTNPTIFAIFSNALWTFMITFGLSGRKRPACAVAVLSAPVTTALWLVEAMYDFNRWEASRTLRERNLPKFILPRSIYNWDEFAKAEQMKNQIPTG